MKHRYFKSLLAILFLMVGAKAFAYDAEINGIYYNFSGTKATVTYLYYESSNSPSYSGNVVIPASVTYNGETYTVTSIGERAFQNCYRLTSITIPESVTSIGEGAFYGCSGLTSITIPESVTSIGEGAFSYCSGLTSVTIPEGVTSIGSSAFSNCSGLTSITIPESVKSIGSSAFYDCSGLTSITIPEGVTSIGNRAFEGCRGLTEVYFNATKCTTMGSYDKPVFNNCTSLATLNIGDNVQNIPAYAFYNCSRLTYITIPEGVTSIGSSAFRNCYRLTTITCLNPTPPVCGSGIFFSEDYVRDPYDVYTYATLHVPMGSDELYGSAYEWRYFNKIKADMESGGKVHYANLTVKQGETGYTRQAVKAAETYTIYIGSLGTNKVNSVTFNGADVTDEIVNGYYTTPEIKGESVLSIVFEAQTAVASPMLKDVRVRGFNSEIQVCNIDEPSDVSVYTTDGKLVGNVPSALGSTSISVNPDQLYVVRVGERTYKVAL